MRCSVSIHAPVKGATPRRSSRARCRGFNPRAREGRDLTAVGDVEHDGVSIHAPVKGATLVHQTLAVALVFQSTRP